MGGMLLLNYLGKTGKRTPLKAAAVFSAGWNAFESADSLEKPVNWLLFNYYLTSCLKSSVTRHRQVFDKLFNMNLVMKAKTIREFDKQFTTVMFGYPSVEAYYEDASPCHKLKKIGIPVLCLNSLDDVFSPNHAIPVEIAKQNTNIALILTSYGGHIGFLEGLLEPLNPDGGGALVASACSSFFRAGRVTWGVRRADAEAEASRDPLLPGDFVRALFRLLCGSFGQDIYNALFGCKFLRNAFFTDQYTSTEAEFAFKTVLKWQHRKGNLCCKERKLQDGKCISNKKAVLKKEVPQLSATTNRGKRKCNIVKNKTSYENKKPNKSSVDCKTRPIEARCQRHAARCGEIESDTVEIKDRILHAKQSTVQVIQNGLSEAKHCPGPTPVKSFNLEFDIHPENTSMKIITEQASVKQVKRETTEIKPQDPVDKQLVQAPANKTSEINESRTSVPKVPLTTKCDGFFTSEEHIQKLKEAAKDGDKQLIIDAGQKRFGAISCNICGMLYTASNPEDETQHLLFHNQFISAVKYVGWKKERILSEYPDGKIIMVLPDDPKYALRKVDEIREMVDNDLGFQQAPLTCSRTKTLLFISNDKKVIGCLIAEHIQWGYRVIEEKIPDISSENDKLTFERQKAWCCSTTPEPAICGISRIWVFSMMRRKKIASRILECLRNNFIYGSYLSKEEIAFSDPTPDGKLFATQYFV
ncbi:N-acetyltransferase ESCO1 [Crotalus adamanteus]|uniref:N-acetyltransferase ESCO1 n=1 Tax=Crotalus adamanteus TaxID=8729 RepID=A0AAW1BNH5_CROAD